jgi:predicted DNA-binding transcriptional regulator AlpA
MISTRQAARQLGLHATTLSRYIASKKVPAPKTVTLGGMRVHDWSDRDIERVRELLPKIKNGKKDRKEEVRERDAPVLVTPSAPLTKAA